MLLSPPPPPPPSPPLPPSLFPFQDTSSVAGAGGHHHYSYNPSILIIAAIIASAIIAAASIHLLLRSISRSRSPPLIYHTSSSSSPSTSSRLPPPSDQDPMALIDSLPLFSLSSTSTSKFPHPPSSLDCAVCLSPFTFSDELRLLPACRHAFHSQCIDTWLKSNLSCPLCRSPISPIPPQPPPPPQPETARSDSFRVEIGSVSRRTEDDSTRAPHVRSRSYSLGSSFEYVVEDEIEAVISRIRRKPDLEEAGAAPPRSPAAEVAELVGGSQRSWLKEYVDRLASSASSSFSSLRFSQRGSNRFDSDGGGGGGGGDGWDSERNLQLHTEEGGDDVEGILSTFYRWFVGV